MSIVYLPALFVVLNVSYYEHQYQSLLLAVINASRDERRRSFFRSAHVPNLFIVLKASYKICRLQSTYVMYLFLVSIGCTKRMVRLVQLQTFPLPDWGMLRRSRRVLIFIYTRSSK